MQQLNIIENDQIQYFIDVIVNDLSEALQITKGDSIFILTQVGWDHIKIGDLFLNYNSIDQVLINLGLSYQIQNPLTQEPILCPICFTNQINVQLSCNHQCCSICLKMHVEEQLKIISFPKCFQFQCEKFIPTNFYSDLTQFKNQVKQSVLKNKKRCINKKCSILIESSLKTCFIRCQCGYLNCTLCHNGDHRPLSCALAQQQLQLFSDLKVKPNNSLLNAYTQCPRCLVAIEKKGGCNNMICKTSIGCGYSFCWVCKQPWIPNHKCNNVKQVGRINLLSRSHYKKANTIPNIFKLKWQQEIQNEQDQEIIQKCFDFLDIADDLKRKETIYLLNNPGLKIQSFHDSFFYERFMYYKSEIFNIFKSNCNQNDRLTDIIILTKKPIINLALNIKIILSQQNQLTFQILQSSKLIFG